MLVDVINNYFSDNEVISVLPFGNGHINDTYKVDLVDNKCSYILQRINTNVFKNPKGIVDNHRRLQEHFSSTNQSLSIAKIFPNTMGNFITYNNSGYAWRLMEFIPNSFSIEIVETGWQAFEAGKAFGCFANICSNLDHNDFSEAIKDFHSLSFRLKQLNEAIERDRADRMNSVRNEILFFMQRKGKLSEIENLINEGEIPTRVVHNDSKINNVLFRGEKVVAIIDLDTVGPGILFNDYGDALRTIACTAREDEKDISKVKFNLNSFKQFSKGYLNQVKGFVTKAESENLYLAPLLLTYIMGIRFLTDYLNGDVYYKTSYLDHNLIRCKVQMAHIESMESSENVMKEVVDKILSE